jgi:hypothetical protein
MPGWGEAKTTDFGMRWGPVEVVRAARLPEGHGAALQVRTDAGVLLDIMVSEKGRAVRVFARTGNIEMNGFEDD